MKEQIKFVVLIAIALYFGYRAYQVFFYVPHIHLQSMKLYNLQNQKTKIDISERNSAIIIFFQTWCGPCVQEMQLIQKYYSEFNFTKIYFISDESSEKVLNLKNRLHLDSLNIYLSNEPLSSLGIKVFPIIYIIKKDKIVETHKGAFIDKSNFEDEIFHLKKILQ